MLNAQCCVYRGDHAALSTSLAVQLQRLLVTHTLVHKALEVWKEGGMTLLLDVQLQRLLVIRTLIHKVI